MDYMIFPKIPSNYKKLGAEEYTAQCNLQFEKLKATLDKHIGDRYHGINDNLESITAAFLLKQDIEMEGHILRKGMRGLVVNNARELSSLFDKNYWNGMPLADRDLLKSTTSYPQEDIVQSYVPPVEINNRRTNVNLWDLQQEIFDEYEVDRFFELKSVFAANMANAFFENGTLVEDDYSRLVTDLYQIASRYLEALNNISVQNLAVIEDKEIPAEEDTLDNFSSFSAELEKRQHIVEISGIKPEAPQTAEANEKEEIVNRLDYAKRISANPRDISAILSYEPFTAAQAKLYMDAGLHFYHVGLIKNGIQVPYTSDMIDDKAQVYFIPTNPDTIDADLSQYQNDMFVVDETQMSVKEVRAMKFLFRAIEDWKEIDLPANYVPELLTDYKDSNEHFDINTVATLREICLPPQTMADAAANHGYSVAELVDILYPANTRLSADKQERQDAQILFAQEKQGQKEEQKENTPVQNATERFTIIDATYEFTENPEETAFALWDNATQDFYKINNVISTITTREEAEQYKKEVIAKETEKILPEEHSTEPEPIVAKENSLPDFSSFLSEHEKHISSLLKSGKPTVIINAFAGPGAGKSTACMDICSGLKKAGFSADYVQEYAKELVYEGSELLDGTAEHQFEVLKEQTKRQDRLIGAVDFLVTDSPILLNGIYNQELTPEYSHMLSDLNKQYDTCGAKNFCFFVKRDNIPEHFEQSGRIHDFEESIQKDNEVKEMLSSLNIYYGSYDYDSIQKVVANAIRTREKHIKSLQAEEKKKNPEVQSKPSRGQSKPRKHYYSPEESETMIAYLKNTVSIVDVISEFEPLTRKNNRYFQGKNHDSLVVDSKEGKNCFYWNSMQEKGSVIDACRVFGNMDTSEALTYLYDIVGGQEAVYEHLYGNNPTAVTYEPNTHPASIESTTRPPGNVELPPKDSTRKNVYAYLGKTRCIHPDVIQEFFDRDMLYQDTYKNCVFVAHDKEGNPNFAIKRGTNTYKRFLADCKGNDYTAGFYVDNGAANLFVAESVIDVMSKMSLLAEKGIDYHKYNYIAMAGTEKQEPLIHILTTYPENNSITLGLDNDKGGRAAMDAIKDSLAEIDIPIKIDIPEKEGQDWNDYLKEYVKQKIQGNATDFEKNTQPTPFDKKMANNPIKSASQKQSGALNQRLEIEQQ